MADSDLDKEADAKRAPKPPSQMKLVIVGAAALFVALVGAQVTVPLINRALEGAPASARAADVASDETIAADDRQHDGPLAPALYVALDPPFVVSFDEDGGARYLQLTLQAMARNEQTISQVKQHAPAIRNAFLFLLSSYQIAELTTLEGKEKLRLAMIGAANDILVKNRGEPIEDLYFTSLVIQ